MDPVERRDEEERWERAQRHHHIVTGIAICLTIAIAGLIWYTYPVLKQQDASLATMRDRFRDQVKRIEDRIPEMRASLRDKAAKTKQELRDRIDGARGQASKSDRDAYANLDTRLSSEIQSQNDGAAKLTDRVATLETAHAADQTQIAQLQQELDQVRQQHLADVEKVAFEANRNQKSQVADGISLYITGTDVVNKRVSGWVRVGSEHNNLPLVGQNALEPVVFYGSQDGKRRELVITQVAKNSVMGYLLLPKEDTEAAPDTAVD